MQIEESSYTKGKGEGQGKEKEEKKQCLLRSSIIGEERAFKVIKSLTLFPLDC